MNPQKLSPKIFNNNEVVSIIDGRKTMFREVVKPQFDKLIQPNTVNGGFEIINLRGSIDITNPKYQIGDIIYCKEAFDTILMEGGEKTEGLFNQFLFADLYFKTGNEGARLNAKQCAKLCTEEIVGALYNEGVREEDGTRSFWYEVQTDIDAL